MTRKRVIYTRKAFQPAVFAVMAICMMILACSPVPTAGTTPMPTITPAFTPNPPPKPNPLNASDPARGKISALFCDDTSGSYNRKYFDESKGLISDSFVSAVRPNQLGLTLYVATINSDPVAPNNSLDPLVIPAIVGYPALKIVPTPTVLNPLVKVTVAQGNDQTNDTNIGEFNAAVAQVNQQVQSASNAAKSNIKKLRDWNPPLDDVGTSVYWCLYLVKNRLQVTNDIKQLYIASDLEDNVLTNLRDELVQEHILNGVTVHVIDFPGSETDAQKRTYWCSFFHNAGASAVRIDDTATTQGLSNLFETDVHLKSTC